MNTNTTEDAAVKKKCREQKTLEQWLQAVQKTPVS